MRFKIGDRVYCKEAPNHVFEVVELSERKARLSLKGYTYRMPLNSIFHVNPLESLPLTKEEKELLIALNTVKYNPYMAC